MVVSAKLFRSPLLHHYFCHQEPAIRITNINNASPSPLHFIMQHHSSWLGIMISLDTYQTPGWLHPRLDLLPHGKSNHQRNHSKKTNHNQRKILLVQRLESQ
jgi:hypothetical protein